jgi:deoxyribodipyrimidine photolyase-related protein
MSPSVFASRLQQLNASAPAPARFVFAPYDQLTAAIGPLSRATPAELGIVVVECPEKARKRPYHQQKLALVLTNLRHFALEQAALGRRVVHLVAAGDDSDGPVAANGRRALLSMTPPSANCASTCRGSWTG